MKTFEDFEFSSPLSVQEALQLLKTKTEGYTSGFSGTVTGNQFFLSHEGESRSTTEDDPQLSGYILSESKGCRVFARIRVAEQIEVKYRFNMFLFLFTGVVVLLSVKESSLSGMTNWSNSPGAAKILLYLLVFGITAFGSWYLWRNHEKRGKPVIIEQFQRMLGALPTDQNGVKIG